MIEKFAQRDASALPLTPPIPVVAPVTVATIAPSGNLPPEFTVPSPSVTLAGPLSTPTHMVEDTFPDVDPAKDTSSLPFKYDEAENLDEVYKYLLSTYGEHYIGKNNVQVNDLVLAQDHKEVMGFWKLNAVKYLLRYGKKGGCNRKDLLKAIHYVILLMHLDTQLAEAKAATEKG
jgi:hypothetical protein